VETVASGPLPDRRSARFMVADPRGGAWEVTFADPVRQSEGWRVSDATADDVA